MNILQQRPRTVTVHPDPGRHRHERVPADMAAQPHAHRVLRDGRGLAITKWPELSRPRPWGLEEGTVVTILVAMSVLALFGLRYPQRMLPILLFEVGWKLFG